MSLATPREGRGLAALTATLLASSTADAYTLIAFLWIAANRGASGIALGVIAACAGLPSVLTAPLAGRLLQGERVRRLVIADNVGRGVVLAALVVADVEGRLTVPVLAAAAAAGAGLSPFTMAGVRVLVPQLTPAHKLVHANTVLSIGDQLPMAVGPAAAGVALDAVGPRGTIALAATLFLVAALAAARVPSPTRSIQDRGAAQIRPTSALRVLRDDKALRALMLLTFCYYFAYGPLESALPLFARNSLGADASSFGLLWSALGAGAMLGLLAAPRLGRYRPGVVNGAGTLAWGMVLLPLPLAASVPTAAMILFIGGAVWGPYTPIEVSTFQRLAPATAHGELFGLRRALQVAASPTGAGVGGALTTAIGAKAVIACSAVACIATGAAALCSPSFRAVRRAGLDPDERSTAD